MTNHSIMDWERRDPLEMWKIEERVRCSALVLMWVIILAGFVAILHLAVEPNILPKAQASVIEDDSYICTHIGEYPIEQHKAITSYCTDLMKRGL